MMTFHFSQSSVSTKETCRNKYICYKISLSHCLPLSPQINRHGKNFPKKGPRHHSSTFFLFGKELGRIENCSENVINIFVRFE